MALLKKTDLPSTDELLARLSALEAKVPAEARRLHERTEALRAEIHAPRGFALPRARQEEVLGRAEEIARLEGVAPRLEALLEWVRRGRGLAQALRGRPSPGHDPETASWVEERCGHWEAALEALGGVDLKVPAVEHAQETAEQAVQTLQLLEEALKLLERAQGVLRKLREHGIEIEGAALEAHLREVRKAFRSAGPSRGSLDELEARLPPLEEVLSRQSKEPEEYRDAAEIIAEVEEWHREQGPLGQLGEEPVRMLRDLRDRLVSAQGRWRHHDPEDVEAMLAEARSLLQGAEESARRSRTEALDDLRRQVRILTQLAGTSLAEGEVARLAERSVEDPRSHAEWWAELERAREGFLAEAENERDELAARWRDRRLALDNLLLALSDTPMGEASRSLLFRLETSLVEISELGESAEPGELLRGLHSLDRVREEAEALKAAAGEESRGLDARWAAIRDRIDALLAEADRAGVAAADLRDRHGEAARGAVTSLEEAEASAREIEREVGRAEADFVHACTQAVEAAAAAVARIATAVAAAGLEAEDLAPPEPLSPDAGVEAAAAAAIAALERRSAAEGEAEAAWTVLSERRRALLARLQELPAGALRPGDREAAERLAAELAAGPWDEAAAATERLELLAPVAGRGEELLAHLAHEEEEARQRLAALRDRFHRFKSEGLQGSCESLADRVEALIRGVPERPVRWPPVLHQIERGEDLLARLEVHARRLAVAALDDQVPILERRRDQEEDAEAERLLAELAACDGRELPPAPLRRRIARSARRLRGGGRRRSRG
jgi:hypothetical protein